MGASERRRAEVAEVGHHEGVLGVRGGGVVRHHQLQAPRWGVLRDVDAAPCQGRGVGAGAWAGGGGAGGIGSSVTVVGSWWGGQANPAWHNCRKFVGRLWSGWVGCSSEGACASGCSNRNRVGTPSRGPKSPRKPWVGWADRQPGTAHEANMPHACEFA